MERFFFFVFRFLGPFPFLHLSLPLPALGPRSLLVRLFPVHNRPLFPLLFAPFALPCFHIPSFLLCDNYLLYSLDFILSSFLSSHTRPLPFLSTSIPPQTSPSLPNRWPLDLPILHRLEPQCHPRFSRYRWDIVVCARHLPAPLCLRPRSLIASTLPRDSLGRPYIRNRT